ncbi:hypothetical protein EV360DRAFT_75725 [Lentinula raphanica]|nr:hypothetical protein EV360DRAFT_75725 [Lentinula raphanica]
MSAKPSAFTSDTPSSLQHSADECAPYVSNRRFHGRQYYKNTCSHRQFLPPDQPPPREGILVVSCDHITPVYQLGWWIPWGKLPEYFPGKSAELSTFWQDEVRKPWNKAGLNEKYTSKKYKNVRYQPMLTSGTQNRNAYLFIWIMDNDKQEAIDMAQNKEYIEDVKRMAQIKESFDKKLQWIKFGRVW